MAREQHLPLKKAHLLQLKDADKSVFNGTVNLDNQSVLNINEIFNGGNTGEQQYREYLLETVPFWRTQR